MQYQILELGQTSSTNTFLRGYPPPRPAEVTVVTADYQTAGRGQTGNTWESAPGQNLLFSILVEPTALEASQTFALSEAIALSIRDTAELILADTALRAIGREAGAATAAAHGDVKVKWPNDIYVGHSKLAGILIENEFGGRRVSRSVIGCGVNVNQREFDFPEQLAGRRQHIPTPTSLALLAGGEVERAIVLTNIIERFCGRYADILEGRQAAVHAAYLAHLYRRTGMHAFADAGGHFAAEIAGVEPGGHLLLRDAAGTVRRYAFKEVEWLPEG